MGKSVLMERLFNITFYKNEGIIPFYYEIKETKMWVVDFCIDFCLTFVYQYIAFKTRNAAYLRSYEKGNLEKAKKLAESEKLNRLVELISGIEYAVNHNYYGILWETAREAPKMIADSENEYIVQMIDEFQFLNAMIYRDKEMKIPAQDLAGGYLSTAESKIAPLLVSGSWVGWLMNELNTMLPTRFRFEYLDNMPEDEAVDMIYKYSRFFEVPVTEEIAYLINQITQGSPFYITRWNLKPWITAGISNPPGWNMFLLL